MVIALYRGRCWQARPAAQIDLQSERQDPRVPADLQREWREQRILAAILTVQLEH